MSDFDAALAAYRAGRRDEAKERCHALLRAKRNHFHALMLLADIAGAEGRHHDELQCIEQAVRATPKDARARAHYGQRLLSLGHPAKALPHFEKAQKLDPELDSAIGGIAGVHEAKNDYVRARRVIDAALKRGTPGPMLGLVAVRVLARDGDDAERARAIDLAEAVLAAHDAETTPIRALRFELAKQLEKAGRHADAFAAAEAGNAMMRAPYDRAAAEAHVDALIAAFSRNAIEAMPRSTVESDRPVFLVGVPRCGSTLTERIIHAHPAAFGAGETDAMLRALATLPPHDFPAAFGTLEAAALTAAAEHYLALLQKLDRRAERVTNKHLGSARTLGAIARLLPNARVVWCQRDPVNLGLSCFLERLAPAQAPWASDLGDLGHHIRLTERLMRHWVEVLDVPILELSYESVVEDLDGAARRVIDFLGLPWDDACLAYHEVKRADATLSFDQVRRPIYRASLDRASAYGAALDPLRAALAE